MANPAKDDRETRADDARSAGGGALDSRERGGVAHALRRRDRNAADRVPLDLPRPAVREFLSLEPSRPARVVVHV